MDMDNEQCGALVLNAILLSAIILVYVFPLKQAIVAYFRNNLFSLRDEVFDLFVKFGVPHDNESHLLFRRICNGFIREVDLLHPGSLVLLQMFFPRADEMEPIDTRFGKALESLRNKGLKEEVQKCHRRLVWSVLTFVAFGSITGLLCTVALFLRAISQHFVKKLKKQGPTDFRREIYESGVKPLEQRAEQSGGAPWVPAA
jgi:hypothetical protein